MTTTTTYSDVATAADLGADIWAIDADSNLNSGAENFVITLQANTTLDESGALVAINLKSGDTLTIDGGGDTLDGLGASRGLFVYAGAVTIENLTIANATAVGGSGGGGSVGGGGGAGLGGGLFVGANVVGDSGAVTLDNVTFVADKATGGAGGAANATAGGGVGGGGGGGMGGAGGAASGGLGGGGGVGGGSSGPATGGSGGVDPTGGQGQVGIIPGGGVGAAGGWANSTPGSFAGGGGGGGKLNGVFGRGGGGGANAPQNGSGGFGGGGGAGDDVSGVFSGGGVWTQNVGAGGFGGGGGAGAFGDAAGGAGGFGGGGGGGHPIGGAGGFGGGAGAGAAAGGYTPSGGGVVTAAGGFAPGGGGLGAGGDIFVQAGASLTIEGGSTSGAMLSGGAVSGGAAGGTGAAAGDAFGSGLFIQGNNDITFAPASGQTETIADVIADQNGSLPSATSKGSGGIVINGPGTVALDAANTFTGGVTLEQGALSLANPAAAGTGVITFAPGADATLTFASGVDPTNAIAGFAAGDAIDLVGLIGAYAPATTGGVDPSSFTLAIAGNVVTQTNADGSKLSSRFNVTGQSYTTIVRAFDKAGDLTAVEHEGLTGSRYVADTTLYSGPGTTGNIVSGNELFYVNQTSGLAEVDLDGSGNLTRALYAYPGTTAGSQTGFEADYVAGEIAGGMATYLAPTGASYSTFGVQYDNKYQYVGTVYTFNYAGQTYDAAQYSYSAGAQPKLMEATFSGYTGSGGPNIASFFYDNTGALAASQYAYTGVAGQLFTSDTLLYNSSNVLIAAEYGGYASKPFSSQTTFYNASGAAAQIVRDFTGAASAGSINGQAYNAYEKILNPSFVLQATSYHLDNGGNVYVGVASNVSSPSFGGTGVSANAAELSNTLTGGDWTITGGGTGETFNFAAFFNKAEITDYGAAFGGATDIVSVSTQSFADWTTMLADAAPSGGGANTTFTSTTTGDKLTLDGVTVTQLRGLTGGQAAANFLFHA